MKREVIKVNDFLCPRCKGHLNAGGFVIFSTRNKRKKKGLILLSPEVGNYTVIHHDEYTFQEGEMIEFHCPICLADLTSRRNPQFASVLMIDHKNEEYRVLFSRKAGEWSTYVVSDEEVKTFGKDAGEFQNLFGEEESEYYGNF